MRVSEPGIQTPTFVPSFNERDKGNMDKDKQSPRQTCINLADKVTSFIRDYKSGLLFFGVSIVSICLTPKIFLVGAGLGLTCGMLIDKFVNPCLSLKKPCSYQSLPLKSLLSAEKAALASIGAINSIVATCQQTPSLINQIAPIIGGICIGYLGYQLCNKYLMSRNQSVENQ